MPTMADALVATLKSSGVERIYGLPGDSLNGLTDALRRDGELGWQHVRHEEAAAFAAGAEAHLTGELAVCAASCGPGNLHLINGLFDANRNRSPVLAIAAHIPRVEIGTGYFQETHPQNLFTECSVYCELVSTPEQLPRVVEAAMRAAVSRRGVAVVVVPGEVFMADAPHDELSLPVRSPSFHMRPGEGELDAAAEAINAAKRPTILAGAGCAGAHDAVMEFAGRIKAPIVHALRGKEFLDYDNPYDVGLTGLIGYDSGYRAMEHCDLLVMLGTDFPYAQFYPPRGVPVVQVDVRGENIGRRVPVEHALVGTVSDTLEALAPKLTGNADDAHLTTMRKHFLKRRKKLDELAKPGRGRGPLHPQHVTARVSDLATDDAIFTCDVGTPTVWAARYLEMNGRRRLLGSFSHGSMANALSQAMGAQASHPDRQVVALAGDGGLAMLMGELVTLHQMQLPVKVVVYDNSALSFVELEMKAAGLVNFGTGLENPDFASMAESIGLKGFKVERAKDLDGALKDAFAHPGPAVIDVTVARQELSLPPKITLDQLKGFTLYATRTILSGDGEQIVELAKTNLREL